MRKPQFTARTLVDTIAARTLKLELYDKDIVRDYIPLLGKAPNDPKELDLDAQVLGKLLDVNGANDVFLLMGDAGSGKTSFGQNLFNTLISQYAEGKAIPLWVPLISVTDLKNIIKCHCRDQLKLSENEINELEKLPFILILDGYDEAGTEMNLYRDNNFDDLPVKVVFTCRKEAAFRVREHYQVLFEPNSSKKKLVEYHVLPFNAQRVQSFVERYCRYNKSPWNVDTYFAEFHKLPEIEELITNPYTLMIVMKELPGIIAEQDQRRLAQTLVERVKITRSMVFECYTQNLFARQKKKLLKATLIPPGFEQRYPGVEIEVLMAEFSKKLALAMFQRKVTTICRPPKKLIDKKRGWSLEMFSSSKKQPQEVEDNWASRFFDDDNDPDLSNIRSGCPLKLVGENQWAFRHSSLLYFFASEQLFNSAVVDAWALSGENLNAQFIEDVEALRFLVEKVEREKEFENVLFSIIEASKHECSLVIAAANAITLLNHARISFSGRNFEGIRIGGVYKKVFKATGLIEWVYDIDGKLWESRETLSNDTEVYCFYGANLSNAVCDGTRFDRADLRCVNFSRVTLDNASFDNACLDGADFGELPTLKGDLACYSPDGKWLAIGENRINRFIDDFLIIIYDTSQYQVKLKIESPKEVQLLVIDPSSEYIAAASADHIIRLWDIKTGKIVNEFIGHTKFICSMVFSPLEKLLISCGKDGAAFLWNLEVNRPRARVILESEIPLNQLVYDAEGGGLIGISEGESILRIDGHYSQSEIIPLNSLPYASSGVDLGNEIDALVKNSVRAVQNLRSSADSRQDKINSFGSRMQINPLGSARQLAVGATSHVIYLIDLVSLTITRVLRGHDAPITVLCYRRDGLQLASGSADGTIKVWELTTGGCLHTFIGEPLNVLTLSFCLSLKNKYILASSNAAGLVRMWNTAIRRYENMNRLVNQSIVCADQTMSPISFGPTGGIAIGDKGGQVWVFDADTGKCIPLLQANLLMFESFHLGVTSLLHSPLGKQLAIGTALGVITLWDFVVNSIAHKLTGHSSEVSCLTYNLSGSRLVSGCYGGVINLWDTVTGNNLWRHDSSGLVVFSGFLAGETQITCMVTDLPTPGSQLVCTWSSYNSESGKEVKNNNMPGVLFVRSYNHQKSSAMIIVIRNEILLFSVNDFKNGELLTNHLGIIDIADYCMAGDHFVTTSKADKGANFHLYGLNSKRPIVTVKSLHQFVDLRWSPDGKALATIDKSGALKLWRLEETNKGAIFRLVWTSLHGLTTDNLKISGIRGVSELDFNLFKQRGSISGEPARSRETGAIGTSQLALERRNRQVYIPTGEIKLPPSAKNGGFTINQQLWVISLVRHRTDRPDHVYLIIQGIDEQCYTVIEERHFVVNSFKRTYLWGIAGTGLIRRASKSPWDMADEAPNLICSTFAITRDKVTELFKNIDEQESTELNYLISGRSPGLFGQKSYNCLSWCLAHMEKVGLSVRESNPESIRFYDFILAIPRNYLPGNEEDKQGCTIV